MILFKHAAGLGVWCMCACGYIDYERVPVRESSTTEPEGTVPPSSGLSPSTPSSSEEPVEAATSPPLLSPDGSTLALFTFADPVAPWADETGAFVAEPTNLSSTDILLDATLQAHALTFSAGDDYLVIADAPAWQLSEGSADLYFLVETCDDEQGLLTRDAGGSTLPGHFRLELTATCTVWARLQSTDQNAVIESASITTGNWHHAGVNFGPGGAELWVDGQRVDNRPAWTAGIAGNNNSWTVGMSSSLSPEGPDVLPVRNPMGPGRVSHVRISSTRRDFANVPLPPF